MEYTHHVVVKASAQWNFRKFLYQENSPFTQSLFIICPYYILKAHHAPCFAAPLAENGFAFSFICMRAHACMYAGVCWLDITPKAPTASSFALVCPCEKCHIANNEAKGTSATTQGA